MSAIPFVIFFFLKFILFSLSHQVSLLKLPGGKQFPSFPVPTSVRTSGCAPIHILDQRSHRDAGLKLLTQPLPQ